MPETSLGAPSIDRHWLWAARTATVLSMLAVCMQVVEVMRRLFYEFGPFFLLVGLPVLIPYVLILERLRARSAKKGLALAVGWGSLIMCVSGLLLLASVTLYGTLLALTNAALVAAVIQTYYKMRPEPGDRPTLARGFGTAVFFLIFTFFLFYMVLTNQPSRIAANEASATSSLRALVTAQNKYANTNPEKGFATALAGC